MLKFKVLNANSSKFFEFGIFELFWQSVCFKSNNESFENFIKLAIFSKIPQQNPKLQEIYHKYFASGFDSLKFLLQVC